METKNYNTTDLNPEKYIERHVFHRDIFAHYLRWTHVLKEAKINENIVDFGCGKGQLLEVFYRNKYKPLKYIGLDIKKIEIDRLKEKFNAPETLGDNEHYNLYWAKFIVEDLIKPTIELDLLQADKVCSFEVIEHVGKQNASVFLENFKKCGNNNATYYLSTPNYDPKVGAAGNHTYDSGDERGVDVQEFYHGELEDLILSAGFEIVNKFGTFASIKDYKNLLNDWQTKMFDSLREYYDTNLLSNLMAPMFPEQSRNCLWVLKQNNYGNTI